MSSAPKATLSTPPPSPSSSSPTASLRLTSTAPEKSPSSGPSSSSSSSPKKDSNNVAFAWICSLVTSVLSLSNNNNSSSSGTANASGSTGLKQKAPNTPNASTPLIPPPSPSSASKSPAKKSLLSPPLLPTTYNSNSVHPTTIEVSSKPDLDASSANNSNVSTPAPANSTVVPPPASVPSSITPPVKKKTLILDLDETLVHSTIKPVSNHHLTVDVILEGVQCTFYVIKRPHVDTFLRQVSEWYDVTVFTASMRQYADPLLDQLDHKRLFFKGRLFRESCLYKDGSFIKDLGLIGQDLATTIIVDNSPVAYSHNRENALPIDNWLGDNPKDEALLNLLPFLDALRFTQDVRSILSLRMA